MKVLVGTKKRHLEVPEGWKIVDCGVVVVGDKFANVVHVRWEYVESYEVGEEVGNYDFIIRKEKRHGNED